MKKPTVTIALTLATGLILADGVYQAVNINAFQYYATQPDQLAYPILAAILCGIVLTLYHRAAPPSRRWVKMITLGTAAVLTTAYAFHSAHSTVRLFVARYIEYDTPVPIPGWLMLIALTFYLLMLWLWHLFAQACRSLPQKTGSP